MTVKEKARQLIADAGPAGILGRELALMIGVRRCNVSVALQNDVRAGTIRWICERHGRGRYCLPQYAADLLSSLAQEARDMNAAVNERINAKAREKKRRRVQAARIAAGLPPVAQRQPPKPKPKPEPKPAAQVAMPRAPASVFSWGQS